MPHDRPPSDQQIWPWIMNTIGQFVDMNNIMIWLDVCCCCCFFFVCLFKRGLVIHSLQNCHARYSLDKSAVKIDRRVLFPSIYVTACDFLVFYFILFLLFLLFLLFFFFWFLKLCTRIFPLYTPNRGRKPLHVRRRLLSPGWTSSSANQQHEIRTLLELVKNSKQTVCCFYWSWNCRRIRVSTIWNLLGKNKCSWAFPLFK